MNGVTGSGGGDTSTFFAITPQGERIEPDADGVLHCTVDDHVVQLSGGGGGSANGHGGMSPQWGVTTFTHGTNDE